MRFSAWMGRGVRARALAADARRHRRMDKQVHKRRVRIVAQDIIGAAADDDARLARRDRADDLRLCLKDLHRKRLLVRNDAAAVTSEYKKLPGRCSSCDWTKLSAKPLAFAVSLMSSES